jgi:hypothetical protein
MAKEIGKLSLTIAPEALRSIIEGGRLLELADTIANEAAAQISAQLIDQVAASALKGDVAKSGSGASVSFIFDGGDFATVPPRPHWGVVNLDQFRGGVLRRVAAAAAGGQGE